MSHDDAWLQRPLTEADRRIIRLMYGRVSDEPPPFDRLILAAPMHWLRGYRKSVDRLPSPTALDELD